MSTITYEYYKSSTRFQIYSQFNPYKSNKSHNSKKENKKIIQTTPNLSSYILPAVELFILNK